MIKLKHYSRILAIQGIYQSLIKDVPFNRGLENVFDIISEDLEIYEEERSPKDMRFSKLTELLFKHPDYMVEIQAYAEELTEGVENNKNSLLEFLDKSDKNRSVERIDYSVLAIMLVAMFEIKYVEGLDYQVSMNEAIEIAKIYSDEKSPKYINALLQSYLDN